MDRIKKILELVPGIVAAVSAYFILLAIAYYGIYFGLLKISLISVLEFSDYLNLAIDILSWQIPAGILYWLLLIAMHLSYYGIDWLGDRFLNSRVMPRFLRSNVPERRQSPVRAFRRVAGWYDLVLVKAGGDKKALERRGGALATDRAAAVFYGLILSLLAVALVVILMIPGESLPADIAGMKQFMRGVPGLGLLAPCTLLLFAATVVAAPLIADSLLPWPQRLYMFLIGSLVFSVWTAALSATISADSVLMSAGSTIAVSLGTDEKTGAERTLRGHLIGYVAKGILLRDPGGDFHVVRWETVKSFVVE